MVVGLGNPGKKYEKTRHNVGFRVAEELRRDPLLPKVHIFIRQSPFMTMMMNEHGYNVQRVAAYNGIDGAEVLVVMDDFSIPLGTLRLRQEGSSGGHNGLQSILDAFGTLHIPRLRVGIGPVPVGDDPKDFVLRPFTKEEESKVRSEVIPRAADAVRATLREGLEKAMNQFNKKEMNPSPPPSPARGEGKSES